jgi:hypothetical protein
MTAELALASAAFLPAPLANIFTPFSSDDVLPREIVAPAGNFSTGVDVTDRTEPASTGATLV